MRFSDTLASGTVSDELAAGLELITFNNGSDLTDVRNVVAKRITTELFTSDLKHKFGTQPRLRVLGPDR